MGSGIGVECYAPVVTSSRPCPAARSGMDLSLEWPLSRHIAARPSLVLFRCSFINQRLHEGYQVSCCRPGIPLILGVQHVNSHARFNTTDSREPLPETYSSIALGAMQSGGVLSASRAE